MRIAPAYRSTGALAAALMAACVGDSGPAETSDESIEPLQTALAPGPAAANGSGTALAAEDEDGSSQAREERVVSLIPSATELLFALDAGSWVVGRTAHCDHPAEAGVLPEVGNGFSFDLERILALRPTLAVGSVVQEENAVVRSLRDIGVEVLLLPDAHLADVRDAATTLGERLGLRPQADALVARFDASLAGVIDSVAGRDLVRALLIVDRDPWFAAGPGSRLGELLALVGGENVVVSGDWVQLDTEAVLAAAPAVVVEADEDGSADGAWAALSSIPAVREGRVCPVDRDLLSRPGPRIVDAARRIADCLHGTAP